MHHLESHLQFEEAAENGKELTVGAGVLSSIGSLLGTVEIMIRGVCEARGWSESELTSRS
jgi:flagellar biosynthesis component FlhA